MKKISVIILATIFNCIAFGQISNTLVVENKLWSNLWQTVSGGPPPHEMITSFIKFYSDTTIDNESYKKVFASIDEYQLDFNHLGYIREDSSKKVYYRGKNESVSRLLYDFGAQVGDTIHIAYIDLVVVTIDSVQVNNAYQKRMTLSNEGLVGEQWIEGIGSLCGVLSSGCYYITGGKYDLLCFYENQALVYSNPEFQDCYYNTVGIQAPERNSLRAEVIPNPVVSSSIITINCENKQDLMIEVFTLEGLKMKTLWSSKSSVVIRREDYVPGIYIFRVKQKNGDTITGKFVVV